jgi:hypothetical protein
MKLVCHFSPDFTRDQAQAAHAFCNYIRENGIPTSDFQYNGVRWKLKNLDQLKFKLIELSRSASDIVLSKQGLEIYL